LYTQTNAKNRKQLLGDIVEVGGRGGNRITEKNHKYRKNRRQIKNRPKNSPTTPRPASQKRPTERHLPNVTQYKYITVFDKSKLFLSFLIFF
jgi:hypothetical protein